MEPTGDAHLSFWREQLGKDASFVYVIQGEIATPIKVGTAKDPRKRLKELQTGNPQRLNLLYVVPGNRQLENSFHQRLKAARVTGEWFGGEEAKTFLEWIHAYSLDALSTYARTGKLPAAPPAPKRLHRRGLASQGGRHARMGHRWRTMDKPEPNPVTIRFVKPDPVMPADEATKRRMMLSPPSFTPYFAAQMDRELKQRKAA